MSTIRNKNFVTLNQKHEYFMKVALKEAILAYKKDEVPIGAVLVSDDKILVKNHNRKIELMDPTAHAEINVIKMGAKALNNWRLKGLTLYVTTEPCLMCLGAIIHSRIETLVFGTKEAKMGAVVSLYKNLTQTEGIHHKLKLIGGVKEKTAAWLLSRFFKKIRGKRRV